MSALKQLPPRIDFVLGTDGRPVERTIEEIVEEKRAQGVSEEKISHLIKAISEKRASIAAATGAKSSSSHA